MKSAESTTNQVFAFLHGKRATLDGIEGIFQHEVREARYPYPHTVERLNHLPTARGKRTDAYRETKRRLGDDWSTDLTDSDRYFEIATKLGFVG